MSKANVRQLLILGFTVCAFVILVLVWPVSQPTIAGEHDEGTWSVVDCPTQNGAYLVNTSNGEVWLVRGTEKRHVIEAPAPAAKKP